MDQSKSDFKRKWYKFRQRRTAFFSLLILAVVFFISLFSEFFANSNPYFVRFSGKSYFPMVVNYPGRAFQQTNLRPDYRQLCQGTATCLFPPVRYTPLEIAHDVERYPAPPSWEHPLGLDSLGRDIAARMLYGFRVSFLYALGVWLISFTVGTILGAIMGYFGGFVDIVLYRIMEIFFAIPYLIILITLVSIFTPNILLLVCISSLFGWGMICRYMRAEFLKIRRLDYIRSAQSVGCKTRHILFRHILPNALTPIITFSSFFISSSILGLSSLDFLGLGVTPPTPSWGELLRQGKEHFLTAWYLAVFPALGLFSTLALVNFVGEGIRDAFDPKRY